MSEKIVITGQKPTTHVAGKLTSFRANSPQLTADASTTPRKNSTSVLTTTTMEQLTAELEKQDFALGRGFFYKSL